MLGQLWQRAAHMFLQPVQGHGWLVGQDVDTLSELVCDWVPDQPSEWRAAEQKGERSREQTQKDKGLNS